MRTRKLGNSDLHISELGFGCMSLPLEKEKARRIIDLALDANIQFFDTADLYDKGQNEQLLGELLHGKRQKVILSSKVGNVWNSDGTSWHWDASKQHITRAIHATLKRLNTDYLDFYQLHGGTTDDSFEEVTDAFESLKKEGLIRAYGISSIRPNVLKATLPIGKFDGVMMQHSLLDRRPEEWFDFIQDNGASVITRGTVAKGLLTNDWQTRLERTQNYLTYSHEQLRETLTALSTESESLLATALHYNLAHPAVASVIVGASNPEQLQQNIEAYHALDTLPLERLKQLTKADQYTAHRS